MPVPNHQSSPLPLTLLLSIQSAAVSMLLKKAYQPYHFPEPTAGQHNLFGLDRQDVALAFHSASAEALSSIQDDIEELSVAAEGDYRCAFLSLI